MKKSVLYLLLAVLVTGSSALWAAGTQDKSQDTVSVQGSGSVSISADTAEISLAVVVTHEDAAQASGQNAEIMTRVIDAVRAQGIDEKDITTRNYSLYQEAQYLRTGEETAPKYRATNNLTVVVRNIDKAGTVIDAALSAGANQFSGITFYAADTAEAYTRARTLAVQSAHDTASELAELAGRKLGKAITIEEYGGQTRSYDMAAYSGEGVMMKAAAATPVSGGNSEIEVTVHFVYELN
jgi:hypothetical protein